MTRRRATLGGIAAVLFLAACGSSTPAANPTTTRPPAADAKTAAIPKLTRMICEDEVQEDVGAALGVETTAPLAPVWVDHEYSCRYVYASGTMRLAVKQLPDDGRARRAFGALRKRLPVRQTLAGLGEGAFTTTTGAVVVQKDDKVLVVDVHGLPPMFGVPADTRANVAITVAATIMGCWTGE